MNTLQHLVTARTAKSPAKEALVEGNEIYSYSMYNERINQGAHELIKRGIKKGDRVGILCQTSIAYPVIIMSALKIGAIVVPISTGMTAYELNSILKSGDLTAVLYHDDFASILEEAKEGTNISQTIQVEKGAAFTKQFADQPTEDPTLDYDVTPEDIAFMMFTSGTTGNAKGCMLAHGAIAGFLSTSLNEDVEIQEDMRYLVAHPFFHMSTISALVQCISSGLTMVCTKETDPAKIWEIVEHENIKVMLALPPAFTYMMEELEKNPRDISFKLGLSGGTKVPETLIEQFDAQGMTLAQGYGSTEAWIISVWHPDMGWKKISSAGKPVQGVEVKVVDPETREELPTGKIGEIMVRSPYIFKGYWKNEEATNNVLQDGWLAMGDAGRVDEDGFIYIEGRYKDVVVYGGDNIYPDQVEEVIREFDDVLEVALIGLPDQFWGEVPAAFVVKKQGSSLTEQQIVEHCKQKLAAYKVPSVTFKEDLSKNSVGKIVKRTIKEEAIRERDLAHA